MTDLVTEAAAFIGELDSKSREEALKRLKRVPALMDTSTMQGRDCFVAAIDQNDAELVELFLRSGADVNARVPQGIKPARMEDAEPTMTAYAACTGKEDSLSVLLAHHPDLGISDKDGLTAMERAGWCQGGMKNASAFQLSCAVQLMQAGAIEARDSRGLTALQRALTLPMRDGNYIKHLLDQGADMRVLKVGGKMVCPTGADTRLPLVNSAIKLTREYWVNTLRDNTPQDIMKRLAASPPFSMKEERGRILRQRLYIALSSDTAQPLTSATFWQKHGGAKKGLEFVEQIKEHIPPHLAHLRERFDCSELLREEQLPREGSVTAEYVCGAAEGREV